MNRRGIPGPHVQANRREAVELVQHGSGNDAAQPATPPIAAGVDISDRRGALITRHQVSARGGRNLSILEHPEEHAIVDHRRIKEVRRLAGGFSVLIEPHERRRVAGSQPHRARIDAQGAMVPNHAQHLLLAHDSRMALDFLQPVLSYLQVHRPRYMFEGLANAAGAVREQDAGVVFVQHHRQVRREPLALLEHPRRQVA
jgi:hypothetical protein